MLLRVVLSSYKVATVPKALMIAAPMASFAK
jgi:hypothetical protein